MKKVILMCIIFIAIGTGVYLYLDANKEVPYEDLEKLAQIYSQSKLKERNTNIRIETSEDVKFVDKGDFYRVDYGIYPFYLYKETMLDANVITLLSTIDIELKMKKTEIVPVYKGEELPIYLEVGW